MADKYASELAHRKKFSETFNNVVLPAWHMSEGSSRLPFKEEGYTIVSGNNAAMYGINAAANPKYRKDIKNNTLSLDQAETELYERYENQKLNLIENTHPSLATHIFLGSHGPTGKPREYVRLLQQQINMPKDLQDGYLGEITQKALEASGLKDDFDTENFYIDSVKKLYKNDAEYNRHLKNRFYERANNQPTDVSFNGNVYVTPKEEDKNSRVNANASIETPVGSVALDTEGQVNFLGKPMPVADGSVSLGYGKDGPSIYGEYGKYEAQVDDRGARFGMDITDNLRLDVNKDRGEDPRAMLKFSKSFEEGGLVPDEEGIITLPDTGVMQDEVETPVDTEGGFYSVNPAPGESGEAFAERNPLPTLEETFPLGKTDVDADPLSYKPPEDYVSPRVSSSLMDRLGASSGDMTDADTALAESLASSIGSGPSEGDPAYTDPALVSALNVFGTYTDVSTAVDLTRKPEVYADYSDFWSLDNFDNYTALKPADYTIIDNLKTAKERYYLDKSFSDRVDALGWKSKDLQIGDYTLDAAIAQVATEDIMTQINNMELSTATPDSMFGVDWIASTQNKGFFSKITDFFRPKDPNAMSTITAANDFGNSLLLKESDIQLDLPAILTGEKSTTNGVVDRIGSWFTNIRDAELGSLPYDTRVTVGGIADDMFAGLMAGFLTADGKFDYEKAAIAGAGSFLESNVVDMFVNKTYSEVFATTGTNIEPILTRFGIDTTQNLDVSIKQMTNSDAFQTAVDQGLMTEAEYTAIQGASKSATHMKAIGAAGASFITSMAMGGDLEDGLEAAAYAALGVEGAAYLSDAMGAELAGGTVAAALTLLRGGDAKDAAISGGIGYLAANPATAPIAYALMAIQFVLGMKKPSNKTGYASFDLDDFEVQSFGIGDYDPSKRNDSNYDFTKKIAEPLVQIAKGIESEHGINLLGDIQIHYGGRDGLYYTIGSRDVSGTPREMFLNRLDYFDGKDQSTADGGSVYRSRRFGGDQAGIADLYKEMLAEFKYIVDNNITDLSDYTGRKMTKEEAAEKFASVGQMGIPMGVKKGGKILDKTSKVLYNSNQAKNYGLVDKKGKAPPSMRADDVPMNLNEGDFVLSQPAVNLYGKDTIERMVNRASKEAGTNLKSGGKVPVNVHNGEYIIPKNLTKYIGSNVLENMNNRGLMSVGDKTNI